MPPSPPQPLEPHRVTHHPLDRTSALPVLRFPLPQVTDRLLIRAFTTADAEAIYAIHGDPVATRYIAGTLSREASRANLEALIGRVDSTGYGPYAVELRETGQVIGWTGIQQVPGERLIEVLFALQVGHWRRGYATEAAKALVGVCFRQLGLEEVVATVDPGNAASIAVLRKLGCVLVGPFTHKLVEVHGHLYRVTREQFERACPPEDSC
jgi:RimJ/RimL family protein N-acetyltransferase